TSTNGSGPPGPRSVRRRRSLPGGRAVAGAFLVTAAAAGVFAAYLDATAAPSTAWLVAAGDIAPGDVLDGADLDAVAMEVPAAQQDRLVPADARDRVVGRGARAGAGRRPAAVDHRARDRAPR